MIVNPLTGIAEGMGPKDIVDVATAPETSVMLAGFTLTWRPVGEAVAVKITVPVKPLRLRSWRVASVDDPTGIPMEEELAVNVKSGGVETTSTVIGTDLSNDPLVPVNVPV